MKRRSFILAAALLALNLAPVPIAFAASDSDTVSFNTGSKKYHALSCEAVKKCKHCIKISRGEAKQKGGVPCKICGGGEK